MSRICAYCGSAENTLTREHIWPKCIIERVPSYKARFSKRADNVFAGELTIADVCDQCNGGPLSILDAYICQLYDRYFGVFPERGDSIDFKYDWSLLGRWLLKTSYNSARASGSDADVLSRSAQIILGSDPRPPDLAIWLDLAEPTYLERFRDGGIIEAVPVRPAMTRVCQIRIPGQHTPNYIVRMVAINAFYFYLAIPRFPYSGVFDDLQRVVGFFALMACLDPDEDTVHARTTGLTSQLLIVPHLEAEREKYEEFFKRFSNET